MREYRFIDPDDLDTDDVPEPEGPATQVLADALLDVIQVGQQGGLTDDDVDEALRIVHDTRAQIVRSGFRLVLPEE